MNSGHYTALVQEDALFYTKDDAHVSSFSGALDVLDRDLTILLYKKCDDNERIDCLQIASLSSPLAHSDNQPDRASIENPPNCDLTTTKKPRPRGTRTEALRATSDSSFAQSQGVLAKHGELFSTRWQAIQSMMDPNASDLATITSHIHATHQHRSQPPPPPFLVDFLISRSPQTIAALAALVRDPVTFNPLDFPQALIPAAKFESDWTRSGRRAAYYSRIQQSTAKRIYDICDVMRDRAPQDEPRISILRESARKLIETKGPETYMVEAYHGTGISASPSERHAADLANLGLGSSRITQRLKLPDSNFNVFVWTDLTYEFPSRAIDLTATQLRYQFPITQYIERVIIACGGMQSWNSSLGGIGGPNHLVFTPEMEQIFAKVCYYPADHL